MTVATNSHVQVNGIQFKITHSKAIQGSDIRNADFFCTDPFHQIPAVFPWFEEKMQTYP